MKENVLVVLNSLTDTQVATLRKLCEENDYRFSLAANVTEAEQYLPEATIIYGGGSYLIKNAPKLKWFHSASVGVNNYIPVIKEETLLTNSAGAFGLSIAEHIIMVTLMMLRKMPQYRQYTAERQWHKGLPQESIYGQRITVVGTGDIGTRFAERVSAFHPSCINGVSRTGRKKPFFTATYPIDKLDELLPETDLLVSCVPETPETINYLNRKRIALLPHGARIVNVGRGSAIDEDALIEALESGKLAGAALDVFRKEPLPEDSPLYKTANLIITPHISGNLTIDYTKETNFNMFLTNLKHYINSEPMEHVVDRKLGY